MTSVQEYQQEQVKLSDLTWDQENPNQLSKEQIAGIKKSFTKFGNVDPILIDQNNLIVHGNHRALVYKELGIESIPCYRREFKDDNERRLCSQTMNKLHGEYEKIADSNQLLTLFQNQKLDELAELIAQPKEELQRIIQKGHPEIQFYNEDNFDVDKTLEELVPETVLGDIWQLGEHRIICADCTDKRSLDKLLDGKTIDQLNTDPPYGVLYGEKNADLNRMDGGDRIEVQYESDNLDFDYHEMFNTLFQNLQFSDHNTIYIWSGDQHLHEIRQAIEDNNFHFGNYLIWIKNNHVFSGGRKDYNAKHENCIYCWKGKHEFYGPFRTTLLEYDKPLSNRLHPTMKPIQMLVQLITDGSKSEGLVFDPFLGSGSTLIACEQTGRICYGVEIDPHYCDVVVKRWEAYTGKKAEKLQS